MKRAIVLGLGSIAARHRKNLKHLYPNIELFAVSASGREILEPVDDADHVLTNLDELPNSKIDLAIVASPASHHINHASAFLHARIPTLIEKPLSMSSASVKPLLSLTESNPTAVSVGYCLRYLPSAQYVKRTITSGTLGTIYNAFFEVGHYLPDWRPDKNYLHSVSANQNLGGGALLELSHELDYAQWILGNLAVNHARLRSSAELNLEVEDQADIVATTTEGTVVNIHLDFLQHQPTRQARFLASEGVLDWDLMTNTVTVSNKEGVKILFSEPNWDRNKMYLDMLTDFSGKIHGDQSIGATIDESEKVLRLIDEVKYRYPVKLDS